MDIFIVYLYASEHIVPSRTTGLLHLLECPVTDLLHVLLRLLEADE